MMNSGLVISDRVRFVWVRHIFFASLPVLLLSGVILFIPPWDIFATDRYRLISVAVLIATSFYFLLHGFSYRKTSLRVGFLCGTGLLTFFVLGAWSSWMSALPRYALLEWAYFIGSALLGIGLYQSVRESKVEVCSSFFRVVFLAVNLYVFVYLLWYLTGVKCQKLFCVQLMFPGFNNQRIFDILFLPLLILYPMSLNCFPDRWLLKNAYWVSGSVWFSLLYVSGSRTNYLAIVLVCPFVYWLSPHSSLMWLKRFALFLLLGMVVYGLLHGAWPLLNGALLEREETRSLFVSSSLHSRLELWRRGVSIFFEHPLLGAGPMHFSYWGDMPHLSEGSGPHNLIVQLLSEWGIVCAVLFVANALVLFYKAVAKFRKSASRVEVPGDTQCLIIFAAWICMMLAAQTSGTNVLLLAGFTGILAGVIVWESDVAEKTRWSIGYSWLAGVSALVIVFLLNGVYPEITCRKEEASAYLKAYPNDWVISPRFWSQGKIAFSDSYLPQCYKDAERLFVEKRWRGWSAPEKSP